MTSATLPSVVANFGAGGSEPYAAALRTENSAVLFLHEARRGGLVSAAPMDVARWNADADDADLTDVTPLEGARHDLPPHRDHAGRSRRLTRSGPARAST